MFENNKHAGQIILEFLKETPDAIFQVDAATGEQENNESVLRRAVQMARCYRRLGLVPGDVLALSGRNHLDLQIPHIAALMNGLPVNGIDPTYKKDELIDIFKVTEPKIAFCEPECYEEYVRAVEVLGLGTRIFTFGKGDHSMQELIKTYKDDTPIEEFQTATFDGDKIYIWLVSSSGTTGALKIVAITHNSWKSKVSRMVGNLYVKVERNNMAQRMALNVASIQWITGLSFVLNMSLTHHTTVQTSAPPTVENVIDIINKYKPVFTMMSPSLANSILKSEKPCDLTCFEQIVIIGAKIFKEIHLGLRERTNQSTLIVESYGYTEGLGPVLVPNPLGPIGNCGKPSHFAQTKLVDPETGKEITEPYKTGEMWTKGIGFSCYYNNPEETARAFSEDGWFKTGDLLYRDENDNYFFVERIKMLIKYRSYHIIPPELEAVILTHEGVQEVSVTSILSEEDGEHPVACVVRRPGFTVTAQEIKDLIANKLSETKQLRGGVIFFDELPKTHAEKVARAKLQKMIQNMPRE